jgi:predicted nucleic-acid-binding protein
MRAVDTNVLLRLLTRDHAAQTRAAEAFVAPGAWVSHLVLAETVWVLSAVYEVPRPALLAAIESLLEHESLVVQDADVVHAALQRAAARNAPGFTDCLVLEVARRAGHQTLGTFDKALGARDGAQQLAAR